MRVASDAPCSVRIVKRAPQKGVPSILFAFDDSKASRAALRAIMHRTWPEGTSVHVVTVADVTLFASLYYMEFAADELMPTTDGEETKIERIMHSVESELRKKFTTVTSRLRSDTVVQGILDEAKEVNADMIFLGNHGHSKLQRFLLGSVGHGISVRSEATIEIVRAHG
jgi:nucleotide-binding universal stress UspA family protein